jgi:hypothetical protein
VYHLELHSWHAIDPEGIFQIPILELSNAYLPLLKCRALELENEIIKTHKVDYSKLNIADDFSPWVWCSYDYPLGPFLGPLVLFKNERSRYMRIAALTSVFLVLYIVVPMSLVLITHKVLKNRFTFSLRSSPLLSCLSSLFHTSFRVFSNYLSGGRHGSRGK